jgi:divalent metal cation (Fe/Co/Zn/Cd) transporter
MEDLGALIGLFVALCGVILAGLTGNPRFDAAGSVAIGVLLVVIAIVLATEMKSLLIGESATEDETDAIVSAIESSPNISRLIHMRTEHLGPDEILIGAKLEFPQDLTVDELIAALNDAEDRIRAAVPTATLIYLEPDRFDADRPA